MRRRVFTLSPQMSALPAPAVPTLLQETSDADVMGKDSLAIEPPEPYKWVVSSGEGFSFQVRGESCEGTDSAALTIWDWKNQPVAQTSFSMPFTGKVSCNVEGRGTWVITLDGMRGSKCMMRLVRSFSVCPANNAKRSLWRNNEFWVGQCSFPGWHDLEIEGHFVHPPGLTADESRELEAKLVARMGVQVARINLTVNRRDNDGMDLDFALADKCVKAYVSKGLDLDVQLFNPYGAGPGPVLEKYANAKPNVIYPLKEKPYRHYIRECANRYGKYAKFFQIGNEPGNLEQYGGTAEEYVDQLKQAIDEIRRVKPGAPITNGGYCFTNDDTKHIIGAIRGLTDFVAYHWHGDLPGIKAFWADIARMHQDAGYTAPKYANTEMGYHMPKVGGEKANAVNEMQKILYCWAHGQAGVMLYSSREIWWPRQQSREYGFVDHFFCPRFVYGAVSAFIDRYAGFQFARILQESDNLHVYEFRSGKRRMIAVFAVKSPVEIIIKTDARTATLIDPMGNESPLPHAQVVTLQAGEYPQSALLDGVSSVELSNLRCAERPICCELLRQEG